jgi:hypothetical protein
MLQYGTESLISIEQLLGIYKSGKTIIVFGTASTAEKHCNVLDYFNIKISFFADNDKKKHGTIFRGKSVISVENLLEMSNYIVLICSGIGSRPEIMDGLAKLGIKEVYSLHNPARISFSQMKADNKELGILQDRVLLKFYDGLGDNLIKLGILKFLSDSDPNGVRYWAVTDNQPKYEFLSKIFPNAMLVDKKRFEEVKDYRLSILKKITELNFSKSYCFCLHADFHDMFTQYNTNIPEHNYGAKLVESINGRWQCESLFEELVKVTHKWFNVPYGYNFSPKGLLNNYLKDISFPKELQEKKYIVVSLGTASWPNSYPAESTAEFLKFMQSKGFCIALIGYGKEDFERNEKIVKLLPNTNILNFCDKLTSLESFKVVQNCSLFFGLDSGMAHAAYVLDKPSVVLMSLSKFRDIWKHEDSKIKYLANTDIPCKDCFDCINQKYNNRYDKLGECISSTPPEKIIETAIQLLGL